MSVLKRAARVIRVEEAPTIAAVVVSEPDGPAAGRRAARSRGAKSGADEREFAWAGTDDEGDLVFVRRFPAFPAEVRALWKDGEAPRYVEFLPGLYRLGAESGKRTFYLVEPERRPAWTCDETRLPGDPVDSSLVCYECGRRLAWRNIDGVERCACCRPPRFDRNHAAKAGEWKFDQGFAELFVEWFLRPGLDGSGAEVL